MKLRILLAASALALSAAGLHAQLQFASTNVQQRMEPGQKSASFEFKFSNAGAQPVKILALRPSCGCTVARVAKDTYAAGETGVVMATLAVADQEGVQSKTVTVATDETPSRSYLLILTAKVPRFVTFEPQLLYWRFQGPTDTRSIDVTFPPGQPATISGVAEASGKFAVTLVPAPSLPGGRISITPLSTQAACQSRVVLNFTLPGGKSFSRSVFLRVLPNPDSVDPLAAGGPAD